METIYVFLAEGFEEVEALTPVDVLRRGGLDVKTVSMNKQKTVKGAHNVPVECDVLFEDASFGNAAMLILPGGLPGATNLNAHEGLRKLIQDMNASQKPLAAICAAPMVYGELGLLEGKKATCYPGFDKFLKGAEYTASLVEQDGNFITGKGPGASMAFAFAILEHFCGKEKADELKAGMMVE